MANRDVFIQHSLGAHEPAQQDFSLSARPLPDRAGRSLPRLPPAAVAELPGSPPAHTRTGLHRMTQFFFLFLPDPRSAGASTVRIASSNTFLRPFCVRLEAWAAMAPSARVGGCGGRGQGTHLEVPHRANLLGALHALRIRDGREAAFAQPLQRQRVVPQVELGADEDEWDAGRVVRDLPGSALKGARGWSAARHTSGYHCERARRRVRSWSGRPQDRELTFVRTFSKLGGLTMEKQTRKMLVWG